MGRLAGIGVSPGRVAGAVEQMAPALRLPDDDGPIGDVAAEQAAAAAALEAVATDLEGRAARAPAPASDVLGAQAMMARDPALAARVTANVEGGRTAVGAVVEAFGAFRDMLAGAGGYMAERAADLDDIRNRTVAHLLGVPAPGIPDPAYPFILLAEDLAPADTALLDPAKVLGIVTELGGPTSHTAILAKSLAIPAVVACAGALDVATGTTVLVDGGAGTVDVDPEPAQVASALREQAERDATAQTSSGPGRTADGHGVQLLVNVGGERDLEAAAAIDSEGVGLLRTEFLFLDRLEEPDVEEQRAAYRRVFDAFDGRHVVVRTLDAGTDKPLDFVTLPDEPNPALGVRGLRTSRRVPALLDHQLEAIAAAAAGSGAVVWVDAPMVATAAEAAEFAQRAHSFGLPVAGVMVEVPAAALRAVDIVAACDFVSLGTNDLAQYTFAADRLAGELADLLDPWQPALLELVRLTAAAGATAGKPVGVCGEAASDPLLALVLVGLGVTSLSMAPVSVPAVRSALAAHTLARCAELAAMALAAPDGRTARTNVSVA